MPSKWQEFLERVRPKKYGRKHSLVLLNGLAEQSESWYRNVRFWNKFFDIHTPNLLAYEGTFLQERIKSDQPITVDYLVEQLYIYLHQFAQTPPYHIVSSSLGGKIAIEFAVKYPELVNRVVLLCPSGMGDVERLPIMDGVRKNDYNQIIKSVFYTPRKADSNLLKYYKRCFESRRWKMGLIRTVKGTNDHTVRPSMKLMHCPTLLIGGREDKIVDPMEGERAAQDLPNGFSITLPQCGHAPQIEKPWLINRLVVHFLTATTPTAHPSFVKLIMNKPSRQTS
ncbi:MAG: alpha/beta hydrolase [Zavarzinella sp.]